MVELSPVVKCNFAAANTMNMTACVGDLGHTQMHMLDIVVLNKCSNFEHTTMDKRKYRDTRLIEGIAMSSNQQGRKVVVLFLFETATVVIVVVML